MQILRPIIHTHVVYTHIHAHTHTEYFFKKSIENGIKRYIYFDAKIFEISENEGSSKVYEKFML